MIKLIGTTHITPSEEIINTIKLERPDIIGVELCELRLELMVKNPPIVSEQKEDDTLIGKISKAVKKKADEQKIVYGSDMITASRYALDNNIKLVCVDKNIMEIKYLMEKIPANEQAGFMKELSEFENKSLTQQIDEEQVLNELKTKYPISFEFLITLRELYIAYKILKEEVNNPNKKILVFLGKGHIKSMEKLLYG